MLPSIYLYLDYRQYIVDVFAALRESDKSFSLRTVARMAGSTSPNFYQLITSRKLNISSAQVAALAESFSLNKHEESYFETIVGFDHAKNHQEKDKYFQRILVTREYHNIKTIEKKQYDYFSHWYNPVIRELVCCPLYPDNPEWIAERIIPSITEAKVRKSILLLESLELIRRQADKTGWVQTNRTISTPAEVLSMAIVRYHEDLLTLAKESMERFGPQERDIRSVTIGLSPLGLQELKQRMEAFWKELLAFADTQSITEQVVQVNMQLFPLSVAQETRTTENHDEQ